MVMSFLHSWADEATQPGPALAPPAARAPAAAHGGAQAPAPHVDPLFRIPRRAPAANIQAAAATTSAPAGISSIQGDSVATQLARLPLGTFSIEDRAVVEGFMNIRDQTTVADTLLTALLHDLGNAADSDPPIINTLSAIQSATQAAQASAKQGLAKVTKLAMYKTIPGFTPSTSAYMDKLEAMSKLVGTDDSVTLEDMKRVQALAASVNKLTSADPPPPFFKTSRFAPSPYIRHSSWDSVGAVGMVANGPVYAAGAAGSYPAGAAGGYAAGAAGSYAAGAAGSYAAGAAAAGAAGGYAAGAAGGYATGPAGVAPVSAPRLAFDQCRRCGARGHHAYACPLRVTGSSAAAPPAPPASRFQLLPPWCCTHSFPSKFSQHLAFNFATHFPLLNFSNQYFSISPRASTTLNRFDVLPRPSCYGRRCGEPR